MHLKLIFLPLLIIFLIFDLSSCSKKSQKQISSEKDLPHVEESSFSRKTWKSEHEVSSYTPKKKDYNFYFAYKNIHSWFDAVHQGIEAAVLKYKEIGINITYDYIAPEVVSASTQIKNVKDAAYSKEYDVIGIDVADISSLTPVINSLMKEGQKIMTFASSDASKENGCNRIAFVGNMHNYQDGYDLARAFCEKLNYRGQVAILAGAKGAPCHEERVKGAMDVFDKYPEIELVALDYDNDLLFSSYELSMDFIKRFPDLRGIFCCNMTNPVGAARAVLDTGKKGDIVIVGMDHDQEALSYLKDGVIYALGIQDCFSIGFDTVLTALRIADGLLPPESFPEKTDEITTIVYQKDALAVLRTLYVAAE